MRNPMNTHHKSAGFTLIELAIIILIAGILSVPLIQMYANYIVEKDIETTKTRIVDAGRAISISSTIRYPCPSNRALPPTNANYGVDVCSIAGFTLAGVPNCNTTGAEQGICKAPGARDTSDDIDTTAGNNNEFVLIGGVPLKVGGTTIGGVSGSSTVDAWGKQLNYAVSYTSARPNRSEGFTRFKNGVIRVVDEFGNNTAATNDDAQFVIYSSGPDRRGGFQERTGVRLNCNTGVVDGENCDGDNTFTESLAHFEGTLHYDDYMYVQTDQSANLWLVVADGTASNLPTSHIQTIPNGNVGVNTTAPGASSPSGTEVRLDVNGNIVADTVRTRQICMKDGSNCMSLEWNASFFGSQKTSVSGGVRNDCGDGEVISSIGNNQVSCSKADITVTGTQVYCPVTRWVEQILTDGRIKCTGGIICPGGAGCL